MSGSGVRKTENETVVENPDDDTGKEIIHIALYLRLMLVKVPTVFRWEHGGRNAYVTGTFNNWKEQVKHKLLVCSVLKQLNRFRCIAVVTILHT